MAEQVIQSTDLADVPQWDNQKSSYRPRKHKPRQRYADVNSVSRADYGKEMSEKMIALLQDGKTPWGGEDHQQTLQAPHNPVTGRVYSGSNQVALMMRAAEKGYTSNKWLTFANIKQLGGKFISEDKNERKGAKIRTVRVDLALRHRSRTDSDGSPLTMTLVESNRERRSEKLRKLESDGWLLENEIFQSAGFVTLFNADQVTDLGFYHDIEPSMPDTVIPRDMLMQMVNGMGVKVVERGHRVNYVPMNDTIFIPRRELFERDEDFDVALAHGAALATGAKARMARETVGDFNSPDYPKEEFIAQLASGLICSRIGVGSRLNRTEYADQWIEMLKRDPESVMDFISHAQNASSFVLGSSYNSPNKEIYRQYQQASAVENAEAQQKNLELMYPDGLPSENKSSGYKRRGMKR